MEDNRNDIIWDSVLQEAIPLNVMINTLPTKGNLVYEYNPLRNYRLNSIRFWYKESYYTEEELGKEFNVVRKVLNGKEYWDGVPENESDPVLFEPGQLVDFITDKLSFSLEHPVNIIPQHSYDGSVNLIFNDGNNIPRLINTRFSATGRNTYEIVDRKGNTDTNIYDEGDLFDIDTSLYKIVDKIPEVKFLKTSSGGNLKVGNYHFYFKLADGDGNETDFVAESGLVSIFIGDGSYNSVHTGTKNENSTKLVEFSISNIDSAYDYIIVYFSRNTAELGDNSITEYVKINKKFPKTHSRLIITGFEDFENIAATDLNLHYNIASSAYTQAVCLNMLFMGNIKKQDIPYEKLLDLSLLILPKRGIEYYDPGLDLEYTSRNTKESYINANYIYEKTGYWPGELYRFGIVYILPNGELTPVFDVRGAYNIGKESEDFTTIEFNKDKIGSLVKYNNNTFLITEGADNAYSFENAKGVCSFHVNDNEDMNASIYYVEFDIPTKVKEVLKDYVKGYFFVRLSRIPLKLAQGITIGIDNESRLPSIPTAGGILSRLADSLEKTHVETENINGINYITEGFLKRYSFKIERKSSSIWGKIGKIAAITAVVVGAAAAALYTGGASFMFVGTLGNITGAIAGAVPAATGVLGAAAATGAVAGAAGAAAGAIIGTAAAATQDLGLAVSRIGTVHRLNGKATVAPDGHKLVETEESRQLTETFEDRIIIKDPTKNSVQGIICPDFTINQPYYNQIFTGSEHYIEVDNRLRSDIEAYSRSRYFDNDYRHFYIKNYSSKPLDSFVYTKIIAVPDNIVCTGVDNILFRSRAGEAEEAWRYRYVGEEVTDTEDKNYLKINSDIVRGSFGPYLGFINNSIGPALIVNIYIPGYNPSNIQEYINIRMSDNSTYHAITKRIDINDYESIVNGVPELKPVKAYRGDCYICQFTQRINRNFNDPSAPYNDEFVDINSWKNNYDPEDPEKYMQINSGDVNAVPLGMWVTFLLRSSNNLNIRTLDGSNVDEAAMTGHPHGYFPVHPMSTEGVYKKPESFIYNKGFAKSLNERWNFGIPDVPYIKNQFHTRIMYSDIHVNDGFKNGFRVFLGTNYRDYTREYGSIVKLVPFESSLLCVFEHGIALIPVNERAVAGQGAGGNVYINTSNVLPENPKIISDMFGSQWPESVLKVPGRTGDAPLYVYGVDTVAKKIWRTDGSSIECISDFKVQEFLNNNITLGEREITPKIGIRNVKTHYNAFKRDVMFTFYDNTYGFEEKVWNLCWNELLLKFITFYSWVPSYMENINNIPFSFDRNTSKWMAKLGTSHAENSFSDGITLSNVVINNRLENTVTNNFNFEISYITKTGETKTANYLVREDFRNSLVGVLSLSNRVLPNPSIFYNIKYSVEYDLYLNYKKFDIIDLKILDEGDYFGIKLPNDALHAGKIVRILGLIFKKDISNFENILYRDKEGNLSEVVHLYNDPSSIVAVYKNINNSESLLSDIYYRNKKGNLYPDVEYNKINWSLAYAIKIYNPIYIKLFTQDQYNSIINMAEGDDKILLLNRRIYLSNNKDGIYYSCGTIKDLYNEVGKVDREYYIFNPQEGDDTNEDSFALTSPFLEYPIFKDLSGKRPILDRELMLNPDKLVTMLNIKAEILIESEEKTSRNDAYYLNYIAGFDKNTSLISAGYYETSVAITTKWNLLFMSTDFWRHGQSGIFNITEDVEPTKWYGKQHPFEFECIVVNDPSVHKIFSNLEIVANKAKPESFHYEIIGECYDFAKDKPNMYFRLEARKHIWQYNGADILYDKNYLKTTTKWNIKSADLIHLYYDRQDAINDIEDYYHKLGTQVIDGRQFDFNHLSGAEIVYYPNRLEYRIWNHALAVDIDNDFSKVTSIDSGCRGLIAGNMSYLEDKWRVTINPILIVYKNEDNWELNGWTKPPVPIYNSPIPNTVITGNIPKELDCSDIDLKKWLVMDASNRKELDLKDKFMKVRIRYSGEELAVIDFLNTIYRVSYA